MILIPQKKILNSNEPITDSICFHSQQAAEKYLKMYLVYKGIEPEKTHNISDLLYKCKEYSEEFEFLRDIEYLTEYAVSMRYPDDFYIPSKEEAEQSLTDAIKVKDFIYLV